MSDTIHVISLGAGVQSSTVALMAAAGEITPMPQFAVFADTQAEPGSVYDYLDKLEKLLPFEVVRVTAGDLEKETLRSWTKKDGGITVKNSLPAWVMNDGKSKPLMRKCTYDFKVVPIMRYLNKTRLGRTVEQWIGISLDEAHRMKDPIKKWVKNRYPLIELRMTRHDCLRWIQERGFPMPARSACYFCPFHSDHEWRRLRDEQPEYWAKAIEFEVKMQIANSIHSNAKCVPHLHPSCVPLGEVDLRTDTERGQTLLFGNECEGMCGV